MDISLIEKYEQNLPLTLREAATLSGECRTKLYEALKSGALPARKRGKSTLIMPVDLRRRIEALPNFTPASVESDAANHAKTAPARAARAKRRLAPRPRLVAAK